MLDSGKELGVPLLLTSVNPQLFQTAIAAGHGDEDMCSTINVLEDIVGCKVNPNKKIQISVDSKIGIYYYWN
jgi:hypothetical protein